MIADVDRRRLVTELAMRGSARARAAMEIADRLPGRMPSDADLDAYRVAASRYFVLCEALFAMGFADLLACEHPKVAGVAHVCCACGAWGVDEQVSLFDTVDAAAASEGQG